MYLGGCDIGSIVSLAGPSDVTRDEATETVAGVVSNTERNGQSVMGTKNRIASCSS